MWWVTSWSFKLLILIDYGPFVVKRPVQSATMNHALSQFQAKPSNRTYNLKAGPLLVKIWREYDHKIRNWYKELDFIRSYAFLLKVNINMKNFFKKKKSKLWNRDSIIEKYRWIINLLFFSLFSSPKTNLSRRCEINQILNQIFSRNWHDINYWNL